MITTNMSGDGNFYVYTRDPFGEWSEPNSWKFHRILGKSRSKAQMSGTGASVFASFEGESQANEVLQKIRQNPATASWTCFVARGLNRSPLHQVLESQPGSK